MAMWRSKLGNDFDKSYIEKNEKAFKKELDRLRKIPENRLCADCGADGTVWASVNIGVFLCLRCGALHRGLGTHISIPKGCTGTYLWGPDELEQMRSKGNAAARDIYGGNEQRPHPDANDSVWKEYVYDKYVNKAFATHPFPANATQQESIVAPNSIQVMTPPVQLSIEEDLICFDDMPAPGVSTTDRKATPPDFFADFGL